jgi:hypothetical protein
MDVSLGFRIESCLAPRHRLAQQIIRPKPYNATFLAYPPKSKTL